MHDGAPRGFVRLDTAGQHSRYRRIVKMRQKGHSRSRVAKAFGVTVPVVHAAERWVGIVFPTQESFAKPDRNAAILSILESGPYTLTEVATVYGVTRERIRQLRNAQGGKRHESRLDISALMRTLRNPETWCWADFAKKMDCGIPLLQSACSLLGLEPAAQRLLNWRTRRHNGWVYQSKEAAVAQYKAMRDELGRWPRVKDLLAFTTGKHSLLHLWKLRGIFGSRYITQLRLAAGAPANHTPRYVRHGSLKPAIMELAIRPQGVTIDEVVAATGTSKASAMQTLYNMERKSLVKRGAKTILDGRRKSKWFSVESA